MYQSQIEEGFHPKKDVIGMAKATQIEEMLSLEFD